MAPHYVDPASALKEGIEACRKDQWRNGLNVLTQLAQQHEGKVKLPALFYSYLGLAILRVEGRRHVGMELCRHAVELAPTDPDVYANLGWAYFILGRRRRAWLCLERGLALNPHFRRLHEVHELLGVRHPPVVTWLGRAHPLNVMAGRVRQRIDEWREIRREQRELLQSGR